MEDKKGLQVLLQSSSRSHKKNKSGQVNHSFDNPSYLYSLGQSPRLEAKQTKLQLIHLFKFRNKLTNSSIKNSFELHNKMNLDNNTKPKGSNNMTTKLPRAKDKTIVNDFMSNQEELIKRLQKELEGKEKFIRALQADNNLLKVELHKLEQSNNDTSFRVSLEHSKRALNLDHANFQHKKQNILTLIRKKLNTVIHKEKVDNNKLEKLGKGIEAISSTNNYEEFFSVLVTYL